MKIFPRSRIRNKISKWLLEGRKRIENVIDSTPPTMDGRLFIDGPQKQSNFSGGEEYFIKEFMKDHEGQTVTIFDVGAYHGEWSEMVVKNSTGHTRLHAFEPSYIDPRYTNPLSHLVNKGEHSLVWNTVAVSDTTGVATLYDWVGTGDSSFYPRRIKANKHPKPARPEVATIRLDEYIEKNGIIGIDLLKIDTEGHEVAVLRSLGKYLRPDFVKAIQFEYGITYVDAGIYLHDVYALLKEYRICKSYPHRIEETLYHSDREDFHFVNYVALAN